jgi:xanthine dehydrogenase YagS FAD-binding subunit
MNVALAALRAEVVMRGAAGERRLPIGDFHRLPEETPQRDSNLEPGELVVAVDLPPSPFAARSQYLKVRDRASYAFALVSVAAGLDLRDGIVRDAALALGGVAHRPWRVAAAEAALIGMPLDEASISAAADRLLAGARPLKDNAFKVELARRSVARALRTAGGVA